MGKPMTAEEREEDLRLYLEAWFQEPISSNLAVEDLCRLVGGWITAAEDAGAERMRERCARLIEEATTGPTRRLLSDALCDLPLRENPIDA